MESPAEVRLVPCAGAVVRDARGRLLLVRRGTEPGRGLWSVPGGRIEPGETAQEAAVREVEEETGLRVVVSGLAGVVELPAPEGALFVVEDFFARPAPGADPRRLRAGDDAADVGWFFVADVARLPCVDGLLDTLAGWGVVPAQRRQG